MFWWLNRSNTRIIIICVVLCNRSIEARLKSRICIVSIRNLYRPMLKQSNKTTKQRKRRKKTVFWTVLKRKRERKKGVHVDRIMPKLCSGCFHPLAFSPIKCYAEKFENNYKVRYIGEKMAAVTKNNKRKKPKRIRAIHNKSKRSKIIATNQNNRR